MLLALCSLPRTNPGDRKEYVRRNGPYTLVMSAGGLNKLPFGNLPRLLLAWVCTEAVRTQSRELVLGTSLSEFMRKLDLHASGGSSRGGRTRLRNQMRRLFRCTVSLWKSQIELSEDFFKEIINHPIPLDMNILKALKRSSLGLDLYLWVTYRTFPLQTPLRLSWRQVYRQFGAHPANASDRVTVRNFQRKVLRELKKIKLAWPELNYATGKGVLILYPSKPAIPPGQHLSLVE